MAATSYRTATGCKELEAHGSTAATVELWMIRVARAGLQDGKLVLLDSAGHILATLSKAESA
jgi:hypothetical protein